MRKRDSSATEKAYHGLCPPLPEVGKGKDPVGIAANVHQVIVVVDRHSDALDGGETRIQSSFCILHAGMSSSAQSASGIFRSFLHALPGRRFLAALSSLGTNSVPSTSYARRGFPLEYLPLVDILDFCALAEFLLPALTLFLFSILFLFSSANTPHVPHIRRSIPGSFVIQSIPASLRTPGPHRDTLSRAHRLLR